jgi:hypothetical protein
MGRFLMLLSVEGESGVGKTTLAYTAPGRLVGFAFDMGVERALYGGLHHKLFKDHKIQVIPYDPKATSVPPKGEGWPWSKHDITVYELPQPIQLDTIMVTGDEALWNYFIGHLVTVMKDPDVRSIVIDTMTVARRVKADAYLEGLQSNTPEGKQPRERLLQIEWGATNDAIRGIYTTCAGVKKNLVAVHHLTDERKETISSTGQVTQALTGNRILEGLGQTYRFVDVAIRNEKVINPGPDQAMIRTTLNKCGYNLSLEGMPIEDPTWNKLSQLIEDTLGGSLQLEKAV